MFTEYLLPDKSPASTLNFAHVTCVAPAAKVSGGWQNRSDFPVDRKSSISQAHGTVVEGSDRRLYLRQILSSIRTALISIRSFSFEQNSRFGCQA
jgi:hypothetical protein